MAKLSIVRLNSLSIALCYFVVSGCWTLFSDQFFSILLDHPPLADRSSSPSQWFFVAVSTGLLYWLLRYWDSSVCASQESLRKVNRSLRSFSECTKSMTRIDNEISLMESICRICVDVGGHRMAWVAFADKEPGKKLKAAAHWGAEDWFVENLNANWGQSELGNGPAGTCIRTGKITVFQDLIGNPRFKPWRETAERGGYGSCIALPLIESGHVYGALVIFDAEPNAFDSEETGLLEELAEDLSYGIKTIRLKEERAREVNERLMLATVMDQISDGVITFDAGGTIQYINPSFEDLCGFSAKEARGVSIHNFECSQRNPVFYRAILSVFESKKVKAGHFINKKRDGSEYDIDARISPVFDDNGQVVRYVATIRDVSQQVKLQRQLRQAQKMEAMATLSGGIAHDFNNILAIIITNVEMTLEDLKHNSPLKSSLNLVHKAGLRGKTLIKQFLTISRQNEEPQQPVNIGAVVNDCLQLLRSTLPTTIELRKQIEPNLGMVSADPTQMSQVIMNLCTNARDAMLGSGGILDISISKVTLSAAEMRNYPGLSAGHYIKLLVSDTGEGMSREVMDRIFDPFYTTKIQGKGTGLGLSIAHGIIKSHSGNITVNSIKGVGTTFTILLPVAENSNAEAIQIPEEANTEGWGHILFVDDEIDYVAGMKLVLERSGYNVTTETDGSRTLDLIKKNPNEYDILITDQTMPHMTGVKLAEKVLEVRPDIPIILCSGSSPDTDNAMSPENIKLTGISKVLTKPVEREDFIREIKDLFATYKVS
jgi:PAS domain S-box-containing protein